MELYQRYSAKNKVNEEISVSTNAVRKRLKEFKKAEVLINMVRFNLFSSSTVCGLQITIDSNKTEINTSEYLEVQNT